jgi:hypothetical protein
MPTNAIHKEMRCLEDFGKGSVLLKIVDSSYRFRKNLLFYQALHINLFI